MRFDMSKDLANNLRKELIGNLGLILWRHVRPRVVDSAWDVLCDGLQPLHINALEGAFRTDLFVNIKPSKFILPAGDR